MKEKEHVEGFAPQVAWVTRGGDEELAEPLVVRPTSEAIIGTMYAKWIKSWRDLPVLINQWANVVRWEKVTRPFLRTTEFLWQEGHTAHETAEEAQEETLRILALYKEFAETELGDAGRRRARRARARSSPARPGRTRSKALMGDGRALQAGTSHNLGQNFARAFGIQFQGRDKALQYAWTTSWGVSTRLIGGVIMTHGDDNGLILPPRIAPYQVVIVPIPRGNWQETVLPKAREIQRRRCEARGHPRHARRPRRVHARLEVRGVGAARRAAAHRDRTEGHREGAGRRRAPRHAREAADGDGRPRPTPSWRGSTTMQRTLLAARPAVPRRAHDARRAPTTSSSAIMEGRPGFVIAGWCGSSECEAQIKAETQATIRNIPFGGAHTTGSCIRCGKGSPAEAWFAKAY